MIVSSGGVDSFSDNLTLDFTSVGPDSGGVGVVAAGVAGGLHDMEVPFSCLVSSLQADAWAQCVPQIARTLRPVTVALAATSRWQTRLRRVVPRGRVAQRVVSSVRTLRARSTRSALRDAVVWLPFHRVPLASDRGVVTVHDLRVFEMHLASRIDQEIIERNIRAARAVVCSWLHPYRDLLERFPWATDKTFLISLPVLNAGAPVQRRPPREGPLRLLLPGFVTPHKNHELVIRALPLMPRALVAFTGSEDGRHGEVLRALAQELGVSNRIEWRGFLSKDDLEKEYSRADLLVMPTRWEAASGPVYEAIARELPFVASNIAPIRSQVQAMGLPAELFNADSPQELARAVEATVRDYEHHLRSIAVAAPPLRARTWRQTAFDYNRVFEWVAGRGARPVDLMRGIPA